MSSLHHFPLNEITNTVGSKLHFLIEAGQTVGEKRFRIRGKGFNTKFVTGENDKHSCKEMPVGQCGLSF